MNVCGVLVHAHPTRIEAVEARLAAIPGVESHGRAANARLVVTVEDTEGLSAADALAELNAVKLATRTLTCTPLTVKVTGKTPSDVHQQLTLAGYLLHQMVPLQKMVKVMAERTAAIR